MVGPINSAIASALFGQNTASDSRGVGADLLASWAASRVQAASSAVVDQTDPNAPAMSVWTPGVSPRAEVYLDRAFGGKPFFDVNARLYSDLGATGDYKRLFALYSGISALQALADRAGEKDVGATEQERISTQFDRGLREFEQFFSTEKFEDIRLEQGDRVEAAQTTLALPSRSDDYVTRIIHRGDLGATLTGLDPNAKFDIVATSSTGSQSRVTIDLSELGSIPRSLSNIISFVNSKLAASGVSSRLEAVDQTPKTSTITIAGRTITSRFTGARQYALKVDVGAGEKVAFEPVAAAPAFYAVGTVNGGARLIKLEDVGGEAGQPVRMDRPEATSAPTGPNVATGWLGPGEPYQASPAGAYEQRTTAIVSSGANNFEDALRAPGEAVLTLSADDGRTFTVSTAWRGEDVEVWRQRAGESSDQAIADDLAERLTQLLHEQGVAAGVDVWQDGGESGLSIKTGDFLSVSSLVISGRSAPLEAVDPANIVGGLREGVYARRFEAAAVETVGQLFTGTQTFSVTTSTSTRLITIDGGDPGIDAATLETRLNEKLHDFKIAASASLTTNGGAVDLSFNSLHSVTAISATLNGTTHDLLLAAPGAWAAGGLPVAAAGQPFGDAVRVYGATDVPLAANTGAVDVEVVVATPTGDKTVTVSVTAGERLSDPDPSPGEWSAAFQDRLDAALNAAGVYVDSQGADLSHWAVAEDSGQRLVSVKVNGVALDLSGESPAMGLGGAFSAERSFTSAQASTSVSDDVAALLSDQNLSITFDTIWGEKTVSAALDVGDPPSLASAALRLNEALAAAGYDLGVVTTPLSEGGAGLRVVSGASHSIRVAGSVSLGGQAFSLSLDPIDSASAADDPAGAGRVADRAARGASALETVPSSSARTPPTANAGGWFAGRDFDVAIGGGAKVATARSVATASDGSVFVLADLDGDAANSPIKGARDVALFKYDSAGKLIFAEMLGASTSASGYAMAVSTDGKIAIAGSVQGTLTGADAPKGGADSFVSLFDSNGNELWTQRRAATSDDEARAVAFTSGGTVIVAGKTSSSLGSTLALGGADAYVRGYSASGAELFTRQFGTGADDSATALLVRDAGVGVVEIFTGGVENFRGVVRRFTYSSSAGLAADASRDIGAFNSGAINALAASGSSLYVGGEVGAGRLTVGSVASLSIAGTDGFVARLDAGLSSTALDRTTYLGSAQGDAVQGLAVVAGKVYAAGSTSGVISGQGSSGGKAAFMARLDDGGATAWLQVFNSAAGAFTFNGFAVDGSGASPLDVLGLPRGVVASGDNAALVSRSSLRAGDEFLIGVDGQRLTTVKVRAEDTLSSFVNVIKSALGSRGRAEIVKEDGVERIKITAADGHAVRIAAGREGRDALGALGLTPGVVASKTVKPGGITTFGLGLIAADLKLGSAAEIARTKAELSAATSIVRQAYEALLHPNAKELTAEEKALQEKRDNAGPAPALLTAQLANYRAALARLGGG